MIMKFKAVVFPAPSSGVKVGGKKLTVPNQALSIKTILERFTRGEKLEIGRETGEGNIGIDLEKLAHADLVDRAEVADRMAWIQKQEKARAAAAAEADRARLLEEERARIRAEVLAEGQSVAK